MAYDIFISYSHKDKPIADAVCANLEGAGMRCWIAPRDIAPGADWPTAISNAISECKVMVLIFSAHSNSSSDVGRELILAANDNLVIVPFKLDDIAPEPGKKYYLARTHWLDAMNPPTQEQIDTLVRHVKSFLEEMGVTPVPPARKGAPPPVLKRKTTGSLRWLWVALIILLVAAVVVSGIIFLPQFAKPVPTETPTATRTATLPPADTPTLAPTFTEIPTETPTPLPEWVADFAQPILAYRCNHCEVGLGDFSVDMLAALAWYNDTSDCDRPGSSIEFDLPSATMSLINCGIAWKAWLEDFVIGMSVKIPSLDDDCGMYYRGYEGFLISYDGHVTLSDPMFNLDAEVPVEIWNEGEFNEIRIIVWEYSHAIYVNGTPILYADLTEGWKNGTVSLNARGTVIFDWVYGTNLVDYSPP